MVFVFLNLILDFLINWFGNCKFNMSFFLLLVWMEMDKGLIIVGVYLDLIIEFVIRRLEIVCFINLLCWMVDWLLLNFVGGGV